MRHTYECPLRWADLDVLGHVNNVLYADYLQEARIDMFTLHAPIRGGEELAEGVVVVRHEIEFATPLAFRPTPVLIDIWVSEIRAASFTMAYEIYDEVGDGRVVYLRASTVVAPFVFGEERPRRLTHTERDILGRYLEPEPARRPVPREGTTRHVYPLRVRWSDVDAYRHVNNVKYFEYFQEARIQYLMDLRQRDETWGRWAVARIDVDYRRPVLFRLEPYQVHSWISRVGTSSLTIGCELRDGDDLLASGGVVVVAFDPESQSGMQIPERQREQLRAELVTDRAGSLSRGR